MSERTPDDITNKSIDSEEVALTGDLLSSLDEVSNSLLHKYVKKAKKSIEKKMNEPYTDDEDNKVFKRRMYISFAQHARLHESSDENKIRHPENKKAYVQEIESGYKASNKHGRVKFFNKQHGKSAAFNHADIKEETELVERDDKTVSFRGAVHYRDIEKRGVRHRRNQRLHHMVDNNRTQYVITTSFKNRNANPNQLISRQKKQLTDRWRNQRLIRLALLRKNKNLKEDVLNEISDKTVNSYLKKAWKSYHHHMIRAKADYSASDSGSKDRDNRQLKADRHIEKVSRRERGITMAMKKEIKEDSQYIKNRQMIHAAHAEAGKQMGRKERDPELKRIHLHRAKKHEHAAIVLGVIKSIKSNKSKKKK